MKPATAAPGKHDFTDFHVVKINNNKCMKIKLMKQPFSIKVLTLCDVIIL